MKRLSPSGIARTTVLAMALVSAAAGGYGLAKYGHHAMSKARALLQAQEPPPVEAPKDERTVVWRSVATHFHTLQVASIPLSPRGMPRISALEEVGPNILFVTRLGRFGYLDKANHLRSLDLRTPMGLEILGQSKLLADPVFDLAQVRTFDLLRVPTGNDSFDIYASHIRYTGECFQMVVSRRSLIATNAGIQVASPAWEDIYVVRPCIELKETGSPFMGLEGGGRLVMVDENTLLLSVGDYEFDGVNAPHRAAQDTDSDLGKIIEISIAERRGAIYAMGLRNPQGLLITRDGRIWESEHGPRGGDELNLIRRGGNYGWPVVTYGQQYSARPTPWPLNPNPGEHGGYDLPQFAFVPAIAVSNLVEPSTKEFPLWSNRLVVGSLRAQTLFVIKLEGDMVMYVEPIPMRERIRDLITLADGRIAALTDSAQIILLRNAALHKSEESSFTVTGYTNLSLSDPIDIDYEAIDPKIRGARSFQSQCRSCHTLDGQIAAGPPLNGILERDIGSFDGYSYSPALVGLSGKWTAERVRAFIERSDPRFENTTMPSIFMNDRVFGELMTYLATTKAVPLPTPAN